MNSSELKLSALVELRSKRCGRGGGSMTTSELFDSIGAGRNSNAYAAIREMSADGMVRVTPPSASHVNGIKQPSTVTITDLGNRVAGSVRTLMNRAYTRGYRRGRQA